MISTKQKDITYKLMVRGPESTLFHIGDRVLKKVAGQNSQPMVEDFPKQITDGFFYGNISSLNRAIQQVIEYSTKKDLIGEEETSILSSINDGEDKEQTGWIDGSSTYCVELSLTPRGYLEHIEEYRAAQTLFYKHRITQADLDEIRDGIYGKQELND